MISSVSAWSGSIAAAKASQRRAGEEGFSVMDLIGGEAPRGTESISAAPVAPIDNNVKSTIMAGTLAESAEASVRQAFSSAAGTQPAGGAGSAGSAADDEDAKMEVIYNTVVLPDGSKLVQVITKYPDGSTRCSTTHMPGMAGDESGFSKELTKAVNFAADLGRDEFVPSAESSVGADAIKKIAAAVL